MLALIGLIFLLAGPWARVARADETSPPPAGDLQETGCPPVEGAQESCPASGSDGTEGDAVVTATDPQQSEISEETQQQIEDNQPATSSDAGEGEAGDSQEEVTPVETEASDPQEAEPADEGQASDPQEAVPAGEEQEPGSQEPAEMLTLPDDPAPDQESLELPPSIDQQLPDPPASPGEEAVPLIETDAPVLESEDPVEFSTPEPILDAFLAGEPDTESLALPDPQFCPAGSTPADGIPPCSSVQTTIQAAIDDATAAAVAGTVFIEAGTYNESLTIAGFDDNLTLEGGYGGGTSIVNGPAIAISNSSGTITFNNLFFGPSVLITIDNSNVVINGTLGNDAIRMALLNNPNVSIDGRSGDDSLTVNPGGGATYHLTGANAGNVPGGISSFSNIEIITGSSTSNDKLAAPDSDTVFSLTGTEAGSVLGISFSEIETLQGGAGDDTLQGPNTTVWFILSGGDTGDVSGITFSGIENLVGGNAEDWFILLPAPTTFTSLNGGGGGDRLFGTPGDDTFVLTGLDAGTINGQVFSSIENLYGYFSPATGTDTLDYSSYNTPVTVDLMPPTGGTATNLSGIVVRIENVIGGSAGDTLTGDDNDNVLIGNGGNDTLTGNGGNDTLIGGEGDDSLNGGDGDDTYIFEDGWGVDTVSDADGEDVFDFTNVTTDLSIVLDLNEPSPSTSVTNSGGSIYMGGWPAIEIFLSGSGNDEVLFTSYSGAYEIDGTQVTWGEGGDFTFIFDHVENYSIPAEQVLFKSADKPLLIGALQAFANYILALESYDLMAEPLPGLFIGSDMLTLATLLEPGALVQAYLVDAVDNAINNNWTLTDVWNAIDTVATDVGITLWHTLLSTDWYLTCSDTACQDQASLDMRFWISRERDVTLNLNRNADLAEQGLIFEDDLADVTLYADIYYFLELGLSKQVGTGFVDDLYSGDHDGMRYLFYTMDVQTGSPTIDVIYGFLRIQTETFEYAIDQYLDYFTTDPNGGHMTPGDWNIVIADMQSATPAYISAPLVTGTGYAVNLIMQGQAVGEQVPNLGFSDWTIAIGSSDVFAPPTVTITGLDPAVEPFVNTTADQVYDLLENLGDWFAGFSGSDGFDQIIPFTEALLLGQMLNFGQGFKQVFTDYLKKEGGANPDACDPYDPGDGGALCFRDARQLAEAIFQILPYSGSYSDYFDYDTTEHVLTYDIYFGAAPPPDVPFLYLGYDFAPFSGLQITGSVKATVTGTVAYDFTLAFDLDANLPAAIRTQGEALPTLISYALPVPLDYDPLAPQLGRTTQDISFTLILGSADAIPGGTCAPDPDDASLQLCSFDLDLSFDPDPLDPLAPYTSDNSSVTDLVDDLNTLFGDNSLDAYLSATVEPGSDLMYRIAANPDAGVSSLSITSSDPNLWQIGLAAPTVFVSVENLDPVLTADQTFTITLYEYGGSSTVYQFTVLAAETDGSLPDSTPNTDLEDLIADINYALTTAMIDGSPGDASKQLKAGRILTTQDQLGLYATSGAVEYITVASTLAMTSLLVDEAELPEISPLADGFHVDPSEAGYPSFTSSFILAVDGINHTITPTFTDGMTVDQVVAALNLALTSAGLPDIRAALIFDERVGGVCPEGYGPVYRTDPFTGDQDDSLLVLYSRSCSSDRILIAAQDTTTELLVLKDGEEVLQRLGLDIGLHGRRGSSQLALLGLNVDPDLDGDADPYLGASLTVAVPTFNASLRQGFAGLTILGAASAPLDVTLGFNVLLKDPLAPDTGVGLDTLLQNAHDEDPDNPGTGFNYVAEVLLDVAPTAAVVLPVVTQPGDAQFGVVDAIITLSFPDWFHSPAVTTITGPVVVNLGDVWRADALEDVTFAEVADLLDGAVDYLGDIVADPAALLDVPLPFIGLTVRQLFDYIPLFASQVSIVTGRPVDTAQEFLLSLLAVFPAATFRLDPSNWTDLRLGISQTTTSHHDLPLSIYFPSFQDPDNPFPSLEGVQRLYAANVDGYLSVDVSVTLNLALGLNTLLAPSAQRGFIDDSTTLTYAVSSRTTGIDARLKLAYLDVYTHACTTSPCIGETAWVTLDADGNPATVDAATWAFSLTNNNGDGRHYLNENLLASTQETVTGRAIARLPLYHPDPFAFADELYPILYVYVGNLGSFLGGSLAGIHMDADGYPDPAGDGVNPATRYYQLPNLGINGGILELGATINDLLKNVEVLLAGLDTALIVLQNALNEQVFGQILPFIGDALHDLPAVQIFEQMRLALMPALLSAFLGADPNLDTAGTVALIQTTILAAWAGVLQSGVTVTDQDPGDGLICAESDDPDVRSYCEFQMDLGGTITTTVPFDVMLDGLGLTVNATVDLIYTWAWTDFTFAINSVDGFYLDVSGLDELTLTLDGTLQSDPTPSDTITGVIQFLPFRAADGNTSGTSAMHYVITIDVRDPDSSGQFTFAELADVGTEPSQVMHAVLNGTYEVHLTINCSFDGSALFPNINLEFNALWTFADVELDPFRPDLLYAGDKPDVEYADVRINFGSFLSSILRPVLDIVFKVLQPFAWLIDPQSGFLFKVDPVMSFLTGRTLRIIDELELLFRGVKNLRPFLNAITYLYGFAKQMNGLGDTSQLYLQVGSLTLPDYDGSPIAGWLQSEVEDYMDTGGTDVAFELALFQLEDLPDPRAVEYTKNLCKNSSGGTSKKRECEATAGAKLGDFSIDFPILSDPGMVLLMLAGQDADLVVVNLPALELSASIEFRFMAYTPPPVWVKVGGSFGIEMDLDFGFDTRGIRTYMITRLAEDIADGFYIIVRDPDTGERVPQLTLTAEVNFGASVSLAIVEIGVGGGVRGTAYFYLHDPDNDGKVRWKEIAEVAETNGWIFDVRVKIDLFFYVYVKLDLWITTITLFKFSVNIPVYDKTFNILLPPRLGTTVPVLGGYELYLNMGPFALNRFSGDLRDGDEIFTVFMSGGNLRLRASINGASDYLDKRVTAYRNVVKVIAFGGDGNDVIFAAGLTIPVEFHGGPGNDTLTSSNNPLSALYGDDGDDTLDGGTQGMLLNGGAGNDTLSGGGGNDTLLGSSGNDRLNGNGGNDSLTGGAGDDVLDGGAGDDTYFFASYSGNDSLPAADPGTNDTLDFGAAYGELSGDINAGGISLTGLGYTVRGSGLEFERLLGSRGGGVVSISATGPDGLFVDLGDGSDIYGVFLSNDFQGPLSVQDSGAAWYVDRLSVHTGPGNDTLTLTESGGNLVVNGILDSSPVQPFSFPASGHGLEYLNIHLHAGDDVYDASGVSSTLGDLPIVIRPDDTDSKGSDILTGGPANESFFFSRGWGNDTLTTAGGGTDTLDFHILDDPLAFSLGADGGIYINSLLENTDADDPLTEIDVLTGAAAFGTVKAQDLLVYPYGTNDLTFEWSSIEVILGSRRPNDVLAGRDEQGVWELGKDNRNSYTAGGHAITFKYIEALQGGADVDLFDFTPAERQRFAVKGGAGDDVFRLRDGVLITDIPSAPYFDTAIRSGFNGQDGMDTIDFSYCSTPVSGAVVNLLNGFLANIVTYQGYPTSDRLLNLEGLIGTPYDDVLTGGSEDNTLVGNGGNDTLTGGNGNDTFIAGNLQPVDTAYFLSGAASTPIGVDLPGSDGNDTLNGGLGDDRYMYADEWGVDVISDAGGVDTLDFTRLTAAVTITPLANVVTAVSGISNQVVSNMEAVIGSPQDDTFLFPAGALFSGTLNGYTGPGGPDNDHLDFSAYPAGITVDAAAPGTLDGSQGQVLGIVGHYDNINRLTGTAFTDTFRGTDQEDTFTVQITQIIMQTGGVQTEITFTGIEVLDGDQGADTFNIEETNTEITRMIGNLGNDTFNMIDDALVPGQIDGSNDPDLLDIDTLDYRQWNAAAVVDLVTGSATGIFADADGGIVRIERVNGSTLIDTIYGDEFDNILAGDEGQDRLIGRGGNDTYVFCDDWSLDEVVEEPGGGTDTLDFSAVTTAVTFTLDLAGWHVDDTAGNLVTITNPAIEGFIGSQGYSILDASAWNGYWDVFITDPGTYTGFAGTLEDLTRLGSLGVFDNLDEFIANPTSGPMPYDRLTGLDGPGIFTFTVAQTDYTVDGLIPNMLVFSNFDTLRGGSGDDTFILDGDISISQFLDGQGGSDTVDYSLFTTSAVVVDLLGSPPTATALDGGFTAIENFTGTPLDDEFTGDEHDNTFEGGLGDDTYYFTDEWGNDTITDSGGAADTLDFSLLTGDLTVQVYTGNLTISDGINTLDVTLNSLEQISTGSGDDQFIFMNDGAQVSGGVGMFAAGGGVNRLDYQGYTAIAAVVDLVAGTATGTNGITGFRDIFGGGGDDILSGDDQDNILRGLLGDDLITAAGGIDTLDESWSATDLTIDLSQTLAQVTGIGSDTITGVENLITGSGNDQLCGDAQDNHLQGGSGNDTYCFYDGFGNDTVTDAGGANDTLDFSALTQALTFHVESPLTVSEVTNLVTNLGSDIETLTGGSAPDNFVFADGAALAGGLDGRTGADTIDWSAYSTPRNVTLISLGPLDGFVGSESSSGAFTNIDLLQGGLSLADALHGANLPSVWNAGLGSYTAGLASLAYSGFELLNGNADADIFQFTTPTVFAGNIEGGGGTDTLDYQTYPADVTIDLQNFMADGLTGTFTQIESLLGASGLNDTLIGRNVPGTFELDGADRYITASGTWFFLGFETLMGGAQDDAFQLLANVAYNLLGGLGNDLFAFSDSVTLTGWLDGGGGTNTLDLSAFAAPRAVLLTAPGASVGFDGQDAALTAGFRDINLLVATPTLTDSLQGIDQAATWNIGGVVNLYNSAGRSLGFREFEFYTGGSGDDTFSLGDGVTIPGIVDAGAGVDTLDLSAYTTDVIIDLDSGEATSIRGGLPGSALNFENASGGSGDDFLYGNSLDNILRGNSGDDSLDGRDGDDILWTGPGTDILIGGPGYDTGFVHWLSRFTIPFGDVENLVFLKPPPEQRIPRIPLVLLLIIVDSSEVVGLNCVFCDGFILRLLDEPRNEVFFGKGIGAAASLERFGLPDLPDLLTPFDDRYHLVDGLRVKVFDYNGVQLTGTNSYMRITFLVPLWLLDYDLFVFHWDERLNDGRGGWFLLNLNEIDPYTGHVSFYVNRTGLYLLVVRAEEIQLDCIGEVTAAMPDGDRITAACAYGTTLRIWPVIPWLLPEELQEQFEAGWSTALVGLPDGMSLPVSISFALEQDQPGRIVGVRQQTDTGWKSYDFSVEDGWLDMVSPDTGTFILLIEK